MISKQCAQCGVDFVAYPSDTTRMYCSRACKSAARTVNVAQKACEVCGRQMDRKRYANGRLESTAHYRGRPTCSRACGRIRRLGSMPKDANAVGRRTLLARTCVECGDLKASTSFHRGGDGNHGEVCGSCRWSAMPDTERAKVYARDAARNAATIPQAHHHGHQWTGVELEVIVTRTDLGTSELARLLGRTPAAVKMARQKAQRDPKWVSVAGVRAAS